MKLSVVVLGAYPLGLASARPAGIDVLNALLAGSASDQDDDSGNLLGEGLDQAIGEAESVVTGVTQGSQSGIGRTLVQ
ncbi:hypothetical protein NLG97_g11054 [Lecanicillium saksenae]|uniref:Uncharacterized protein n=1 Tax=Lecanicillium saksenae TaxID=468837 RepID=A0ACC1QDW1_9HYPO|nr:hypothetical protein NLG97_g11054 [Lecanicillium saksenae]